MYIYIMSAPSVSDIISRHFIVPIRSNPQAARGVLAQPDRGIEESGWGRGAVNRHMRTYSTYIYRRVHFIIWMNRDWKHCSCHGHQLIQTKAGDRLVNIIKSALPQSTHSTRWVHEAPRRRSVTLDLTSQLFHGDLWHLWNNDSFPQSTHG